MGCGVDRAGELSGIGPSQGPDDSCGVSRAFVDVGGDVGTVGSVVDDKVGDAVVVGDKPIGGFVQYCSLGIEFGLQSVDCHSIEVCLVSEVSTVMRHRCGSMHGCAPTDDLEPGS